MRSGIRRDAVSRFLIESKWLAGWKERKAASRIPSRRTKWPVYSAAMRAKDLSRPHVRPAMNRYLGSEVVETETAVITVPHIAPGAH